MTDKYGAYYSYLNSPEGRVKITADEDGITSVWFVNDTAEEENPNVFTVQCKIELQEYFEGKRTEFSVKLNPKGSPFQQRVWRALVDIPYGKTITYLDLAKILGDEKLTRAVGTANGKNPIWVVIPCHRVIGTDGSLTGYAGGIHRKKWLLQHEGAIMQTELF